MCLKKTYALSSVNNIHIMKVQCINRQNVSLFTNKLLPVQTSFCQWEIRLFKQSFLEGQPN